MQGCIMSGHVRPSNSRLFRLYQVSSGDVKIFQVCSGLFRICKVMSG